MWIRGLIGFLLSVAGVVWILQGVNVLHGSMMSGHAGYAVLGGAALIVGVALVVSARRGNARG